MGGKVRRHMGLWKNLGDMARIDDRRAGGGVEEDSGVREPRDFSYLQSSAHRRGREIGGWVLLQNLNE